MKRPGRTGARPGLSHSGSYVTYRVRFRSGVVNSEPPVELRIEKPSHYRPISQSVASAAMAMKRKIKKITTTW